MEKVIIYGMGKEFIKNKKRILKLFDIVGCTDSYRKPMDEWENKYYINPNSILNTKFDKILICSSKYNDAIKIKLISMGIAFKQVISLNEIKNNTTNKYNDVIDDLKEYNAKNKDREFEIREDSLMIISNEKSAEAGKPGAHYFAQDIWGARKIYDSNPVKHYDIGSSVNGFIAHLLVFREVNYIDIRPMDYTIPGLHYIYGDAMNLTDIKNGSIESLSSFHAIEHFGLGRYGDAVDPDGYKKGAQSMQRVLAKGGRLYLGVPVGPENKCVFNAHRIFRIETVLALFDKCRLDDIAIIEPEGVAAHEISEKEYDNIKEFSCGLFVFEKL